MNINQDNGFYSQGICILGRVEKKRLSYNNFRLSLHAALSKFSKGRNTILQDNGGRPKKACAQLGGSAEDLAPGKNGGKE